MDDLSSDKSSGERFSASSWSDELEARDWGEGSMRGWSLQESGRNARYPLSDVVGGTPHTTNFDKDIVIRQKIPREKSHRLRKRSAEHESLTRD